MEKEKLESTASVDLSDAIILTLADKDLLSLRCYYPDVLNDSFAKELHEGLLNRLEISLEGINSEVVKKFYKRPDLNDNDAFLVMTYLMVLLSSEHPQYIQTGSESNNMQEVIQICEKNISQSVKDLVEPIMEVKLWYCNVPCPRNDPSYQEPQRLLQLLQEYWRLCSRIILHDTEASVGLIPNPLTRLIVNLRARIDICTEKLNLLEGIEEIKRTIDTLLDIVLSGEPDELSVVPEWTNGEIQKIEFFLEKARLQLGPNKRYKLLHAEKIFIHHANQTIDFYIKEVDKSWSQMVAKVEKSASQAKEADKSSKANIGEKTFNAELTDGQKMDYKKFDYKCCDKVYIPGTVPTKRSNLIVVNGTNTKIGDSIFTLYLRLVVELKKKEGGWVNIHTLESDGIIIDSLNYQIYSNLRTALQGSLLDKNGKKFIQSDGSKNYRISTHPNFFTYNKEKLLNHPDNRIRELAKKLT